MFSQVEDLLPVISFGSKKDGESEKKHGELCNGWPRGGIPRGRFAGWSNGTCG
ncbi:hypothetical protein [Paeniroseomonas aquatica]